MALDTFNPYLFVSAGEQSNKFLTPTYAGGIAKFQAQREQQVNKLLVQVDPVQDLNGQANPYPGGCGKNIMPVSLINRSANPSITTDGDVYTINGTATGYIQGVADEAFTLSAGDYYFKVFMISGTGRAVVQLRSTDGLTTYASIFSDIPMSSGATFNLAEDAEVKFRIAATDATFFANLKIQCMVSKGTTAPTAYAPYSNICPISGRTGLTVTVQSGETQNEYPVTWETEAGTIYGGTLDVVSGVLTADKGFAVYDGTEQWLRDNNGNFYISASGKMPDRKTGMLTSEIYFNMFKTGNVEGGAWVSAGGYLNVKYPSITAINDFKALLASTNMQIVYPLATPQTYQLSPTDVKTLAGFNQVYSDAGPVIDIKF